MPEHTPYCAESDFCVCWMDAKPHGLQTRANTAIAIIGAGFAGLSAADQLINRYGFKNVTVYEALDRVGGRAHTVSFGQGNVELGAQYVQKLPNSIVLRMAEDLEAICSSGGVKVKLLNSFVDVALREGGSVIDKKLATEFRRLLIKTEVKAAKGKLKLNNLPEHVPRSLGAAQTYEYNEWKLKRKEKLTTTQSKDLDLLFKFATKAAEFDYGCDDWYDVSLASTSQFYTVGDSAHDFELLPVNQKGYSSLIQDLLSRLPGECVKLRSPCSNINWVGPRVELEFEDGSTATVEHVVVTVPLGFLQRRTTTFFSPPLPVTKILAMDGLGFGHVEKLFARFEKAFWKPSTRRYELLWGEPQDDEPDADKFARAFFVLQPIQGIQNVACFWITGNIVKTVWNATETLLKDIVQRIVQTFFPFVPETGAYPLAILRSNWSGNKYFLGSYSYYNMKYDSHKHGPNKLADPLYASEDDTPLVLFAGEATCVHCYGTTHGAVVSAHREARRLHLFYKKRSELQPVASCFSGLQAVVK